MRKPTKQKKERVPKITEQQYAEYLFSLRAADGVEENDKNQDEENQTESP